MHERIYLGLGTNLGNRERNLYKAYLECATFISQIKVADVFESLPLYNTDQPRFLNTVLEGNTVLSPTQLLAEITRVEDLLGRDRLSTPKMGPRCIDIDILLFGNRKVISENLTIPHPLMQEREFVLKPLLQLDAELTDPLSGRGFSEIYKNISKQGVCFHLAWKQITGRFLREDH